MRLTQISVEHLVEPLGLAVDRPRFTWVIDPGEARDVRARVAGLQPRRPGYRESRIEPDLDSALAG
jgi:hypothetical protein